MRKRRNKYIKRQQEQSNEKCKEGTNKGTRRIIITKVTQRRKHKRRKIIRKMIIIMTKTRRNITHQRRKTTVRKIKRQRSRKRVSLRLIRSRGTKNNKHNQQEHRNLREPWETQVLIAQQKCNHQNYRKGHVFTKCIGKKHQAILLCSWRWIGKEVRWSEKCIGTICCQFKKSLFNTLRCNNCISALRFWHYVSCGCNEIWSIFKNLFLQNPGTPPKNTKMGMGAAQEVNFGLFSRNPKFHFPISSRSHAKCQRRTHCDRESGHGPPKPKIRFQSLIFRRLAEEEAGYLARLMG